MDLNASLFISFPLPHRYMTEQKRRRFICEISSGRPAAGHGLLDRLSSGYWDPLADDRWNLSPPAGRVAAGDTWSQIKGQEVDVGDGDHGLLNLCRRWLLTPPQPPNNQSHAYNLSSHPHWARIVCVCVWCVCERSDSQKFYLIPHLCGLRHDDFGPQPRQPSCHPELEEKRQMEEVNGCHL